MKKKEQNVCTSPPPSTWKLDEKMQGELALASSITNEANHGQTRYVSSKAQTYNSMTSDPSLPFSLWESHSNLKSAFYCNSLALHGTHSPWVCLISHHIDYVM